MEVPNAGRESCRDQWNGRRGQEKQRMGLLCLGLEDVFSKERENGSLDSLVRLREGEWKVEELCRCVLFFIVL